MCIYQKQNWHEFYRQKSLFEDILTHVECWRPWVGTAVGSEALFCPLTTVPLAGDTWLDSGPGPQPHCHHRWGQHPDRQSRPSPPAVAGSRVGTWPVFLPDFLTSVHRKDFLLELLRWQEWGCVQTVSWPAFLGRACAGGIRREDAILITGCEVLDPALPLQSLWLLRVGHDWVTSLWLFTFMHWRRKWQPTPVFLPGESQAWGSLMGCRLWGHTESDTTEVT